MLHEPVPVEVQICTLLQLKPKQGNVSIFRTIQILYFLSLLVTLRGVVQFHRLFATVNDCRVVSQCPLLLNFLEHGVIALHCPTVHSNSHNDLKNIPFGEALSKKIR